MNVQKNKNPKKKLIIELEKTKEGNYKLKDQYYRVSRKNSICFDKEKKSFYKTPINWEPKNHDFSIKLQKKESLTKLQNDKILKKNPNQKFLNQISNSIPFYSKWFNFDQIHHIEKESLPEYFMEKPSKTPDTYIKSRNFIIMLYWNSPKIYLTATACRRCINGDVSAILRTHAFLEHWGIINNSYNPTTGNLNNFVNRNYSYVFLKEDFENKKGKFDYIFLEFKKSVMKQLFIILKKDRQICFSCEELLELVWFEKRKFENDTQNLKHIYICDSCFKDEKIPIFYCKEDFEKKELKKNFFNEEISEFSFEDKTRLLKFLKNNLGNNNFFEIIKKEFINYKEEYILFEIMKIPFNLEMNQIDNNNKFYNENELTYKKNISETFKEKIKEISDFLKNKKIITEEKKEEMKSKERIIHKEKEDFEDFLDNEFLNKVNKRLEYFSKFEKILEHHKKNLNYIKK